MQSDVRVVQRERDGIGNPYHQTTDYDDQDQSNVEPPFVLSACPAKQYPAKLSDLLIALVSAVFCMSPPLFSPIKSHPQQ